MHFPVSGVDVFPLIPPLAAFLVSSVTASAGVSGAFLLLPFMVSVLGFTTPAVSPTNLIYNIVAIPGGLARYIREGRMAWPLTWVVVIATLPGVFVGAWIRVRYLPDPKAFKLFVGLVLLYLGVRLLYETTGRYLKSKEKTQNLEKKFRERVQQIKSESAGRIAAGLPPEAVVKTRSVSLCKIEYDFWGETFSFSTPVVFTLALVVGLIGGIYGIGGGAIIAPFVVSVLGLPVYTVAGAALAGTFLTSIAGVVVYHLLSLTAAGARAGVSPDWFLGALFGVGGFLGTYFGAYLQKYLPDRLIRGILGSLVTFLAVSYILQYFI
ncbi:putative membrane protein YfcA [Desulfofundulus luciae]|uniref:Probable membrane transporter protein n=1 Tax=Desulfofundulus luciae TaxID=74702 RepID=A0ABU0AY44_9FIRM|nr:sulfite exporter TauE/SafE family protein [Desulfofundulus luciae]MDQ0285406.1 putative membrane protein YfcA [Desulfofundulus luciae]